jgi:hypothetical protein
MPDRALVRADGPGFLRLPALPPFPPHDPPDRPITTPVLNADGYSTDPVPIYHYAWVKADETEHWSRAPDAVLKTKSFVTTERCESHWEAQVATGLSLPPDRPLPRLTFWVVFEIPGWYDEGIDGVLSACERPDALLRSCQFLTLTDIPSAFLVVDEIPAA